MRLMVDPLQAMAVRYVGHGFGDVVCRSRKGRGTRPVKERQRGHFSSQWRGNGGIGFRRIAMRPAEYCAPWQRGARMAPKVGPSHEPLGVHLELRVQVHVVDYGKDRNLMMRYTDPFTGKHVARSTRTRNATKAERTAAKWEGELREGRYQKPNCKTWEEFRAYYSAHALPSLAKRTQES